MSGIIGTHKTTIKDHGNGKISVRYHWTDVVTFDSNTITLNHGGWTSITTKKRMNQVSDYYGLGFGVYQKNFNWFVKYGGKTIPYPNYKLKLNR